nr:F-box/FBD/LRR-repeat protein At5g22660-like [Lolium perenne]
MTGGGDRLSELPDDLLRRVLHFAPLKQAASTTALSRRWRAPLWPSSGAVNLEMDADRARFFSASRAALAVADVRVTRLTLHLESKSTNLLYTLPADSLPQETLRVLELTRCKGFLYMEALALQRLSSLRLSRCSQHLSSLQRFIDAAPALASVRLEDVLIDATDKDKDDANLPSSPTTRRFVCPAATVLVLNYCKWEEKNRRGDIYSAWYYHTVTVDVLGVEINAPRLRRFKYKGLLRSFSFSTRPPDLEQVDLDFSGPDYKRKNLDPDPDRDLATFWRFVGNFISTREMRLRVNQLEEIAVLSEARRIELLPAFRRLQRLEVQGAPSTKGKSAPLAILILLRCCPVLSALRINLATENQNDAQNKEGAPDPRNPQKEIQVAALLGPSHHFQCLRSSLSRVALRFRVEKSDCLGVKLIKFFAENAMVLEEMRIDGGEEKFCEHMNPKTEKWNSKRRKLGATSFAVLPLKR